MPNGLFTLKQQVLAIQEGAWPNQKTPAVDYLVVAGGGGGAYTGGGGAGGVLTGVVTVAAGTSYTVTIGTGGTGSTGGGDNATQGTASVFGVISAAGGGAGLLNYVSPASKNNGGSGGGGSISIVASGQGISGQGNAGGFGSATNGGGGGGAGTVGLAATTIGGNGGAGIASAITGTVTTYGGGGGGGFANVINSNPGLGGVGGGGNAGISSGGVGGSGGDNTGGGGGASVYVNPTYYAGGSGGSGVVIISYPDVYAAPTAITGSPTVSTSGSGSIKFYDVGGSSPSDAPSYIQYTGTSALAIGQTGTYEFWIYPTRFFTNHRIISQGVNSGIEIYYDSSGNLVVGNTSGGASSSVTGALSLNTWTHVAVVFNSGTLTVYFNGTAKSLTGTTTGYNMTSTSTLAISGYPPITGQYGVVGYLSNIRIVKGVAVYTGAFTPPSSPLQATQVAGTNTSAITGTQTSLLLNSVSGSYLADTSTNSYTASAVSSGTALPVWNELSPFATGLGFKNRVYRWTSSGSITF